MFLKLLQISQGNTCVGISLQLATFLQLRDSNTGASCEFCKTVKNTSFTEYFCIPDSVFTEHIWDILKHNVYLLEWILQPFETLVNIEMYTCET